MRESSSFSTVTNYSSLLTAPHQGALCRMEAGSESAAYVISIALSENASHELDFTRRDFEFSQRVFSILDTESRGFVSRVAVQEFVTLRCPVFWRRDEDLKKLGLSREDECPTFDEVWRSVVSCSTTTSYTSSKELMYEMGVEAWMVFCRFIALAQYLEAKRRFSGRHLQQTMRHRNSPRGSEVVVVNVPPPEPPAVLSPRQLANYEQMSKTPLPTPELDLDHSLLAAHDASRRRTPVNNQGMVRISLFGSSNNPTGFVSPSAAIAISANNLEFAVTLLRRSDLESSGDEPTVVRRSMTDIKWLDDTFASHKVLGGTLCGRILPPFPGKDTRMLTSHFQTESDSMLNTSLITTGGAIATAAAGVDRFRTVAKSLLVSYLSSASSSRPTSIDCSPDNVVTAPLQKKSTAKKRSVSRSLPEGYYNPNLPLGKARNLERYLNYLLEHPALSTSFPLNTIIKASQSGLDAAKQSLEECTRTSKEIKDHTPHLDDGKLLISSFLSGSSSNPQSFAWVRTAAQAAMALKVHGMLETTGLNSASARLQHASLPSFGSSARNSNWEDDEPAHHPRESTVDECASVAPEGSNFEEGVIRVESDLRSGEQAIGSDGYDLLPLPVPAPERTILSAGSEMRAFTELEREERFHYGTSIGVHGTLLGADEDDHRSAFLGDISVDENIDKLREVIGSVDNTLSRCLASSGGTGKAQRERQALHLEIVTGLDSWEGMRGKFVSQRSLLKGVTGIEQSKELAEESTLALIDGKFTI
jgi:hypothetical protein